MEKKPSVYVNKIDKQLNNNEKVYFSQKENTKSEKEVRNTSVNDIINSLNNKNIEQQIQEIFNSDSYIYKADVEIVTKDSTITKKVIGRNSNYLITMDNELIPISDIKEIKNKNKNE